MTRPVPPAVADYLVEQAARAFVPGVEVRITVQITEPEGLGMAVAHLNSEQQAEFLIGLATSFAVMGDDPAAGLRQIDFIARALQGRGDANHVAWFVRELDEHLQATTGEDSCRTCQGTGVIETDVPDGTGDMACPDCTEGITR